jgi:D-beta-D-heptose 7-phosphate kinase / D-beta-D-heptose 1-phosphate adenosyltransferase
MSRHAGLLALVERIAGARVGCVGDVMLDRYVFGAVDRISPEAPVPVLRVERRTAMLGGAGNVVRNVLALGGGARFVSVVGDDEAGRELHERLGEEQTRVEHALVIDRERRTSIKTRFLAANQQLLRCDDECTGPISANSRREIVEVMRSWRGDCPVLVVSDYAKGVLADGLASELIDASHGQGVCVVVDPKGVDFGRYRGADVITPNRRELSLAVAAELREGEEAACARALRDRYAFGAVLVTLGRDGMLLIDANGEALALPAEAREVFDVSGAGDTVAATVAVALAVGAALPDAVALANIAAGIVVGKVGTAVARADELRQALRHQDLLRVEEKLFEREALQDRLEVWRRQGLRIGFTNGCFDLVHPGHISLLAQAKAECDRLVVGLNTDSSAARLKGPGRPVQTEAARATVLASISSVDAVVLFAEDTPLALIEAVRPDVLVKGADYRLEEVVGGDVVRRFGGRVVLARLEPGFSTSATIANMTTS